jgi:hypothetical protein
VLLISNSSFLSGIRGRILSALAVTTAAAPAFPPAPFHTIYGIVRDENGQTLRVDGARVVIYKNGTEFLSENIAEMDQPDQNYQIRLRMDMLRNGTQSYTSLASTTGNPFTLGIVIHDVVYHPIEMSVSHAVGKPGERVRLDLTLGVDSDSDGIPDAWEESQLYAGGYLPGENGWDLSVLDRDGDLDGDGISNWREYLAGTYAADPTDFLSMKVTARFPRSLRLSFHSIHGKTYSLESSSDLVTWTSTPLYLSNPDHDIDSGNDDPDTSDAPEYPTDNFSPDNPPAPQATLRANGSELKHIYTPANPSTSTYYRVRVR